MRQWNRWRAAGAVMATRSSDSRTFLTANEPTADGVEASARSDRGASPLTDSGFVAGLRPIPTGRMDAPVPWEPSDLHGVDPEGRLIVLRLAELASRVLLAFLDTSCAGCRDFWQRLDELTDPEAGVSVVAVTKDPPSVVPEDVARLASGCRSARVVLSDRAWVEYRVAGPPFFVLVDTGSWAIVGETVAFGMDDVTSMLGGS